MGGENPPPSRNLFKGVTMKANVVRLDLNPETILEAVQKLPGARTTRYGTGLIRVDILEPCSIYLHGEDGFRMTLLPVQAAQTPDEIVSEFAHEGMTASYHYADDSGEEWGLGSLHQDRAIALWKAHPELTPRFLEIGRKFLWSFSTFVETEEKRQRGEES